ncbi:MAG: response regulator [Solirubrobacteraceae bacterium]|jgi:two-component system chemotaxis response regulator CheY
MARVLIVDDDEVARKLIRRALASSGHEIVGEAGNGVEAVQRFDQLRPQLTTLDITMPEQDGISALAQIVAIDPDARVIMCSALDRAATVLDALTLGARAFVVKPFRRPRLLAAVSRALA